MSSIDRFIEKHSLSADCINEDSVLSYFVSEMEKGLEGKDSSLKMIATYISAEGRVEAGKSVIVMDAGGTNFRSCLVTFDAGLNPVVTDFKKTRMPGFDREVSAAEFFSVLADNVERFIDKSDRIGFCFSYAADILPDRDGVPIMFSKEIKAKEVVGMKLGENLLKELARRGHDVSNKKVVVINDTVATLLAAKASCHENASGYIGFILGTGTNTAYIEYNGNIKKLSLGMGRMVINVESGGLRLGISDLDEAFLATTKDPEHYHFEKMISGAYLGPFAAFVIQKAIDEGVFSAEFGSRFSHIKALGTPEMSHYLESCHNMDYDLVRCVGDNEDDALALYRLLKTIVERAGKLTAINLTAAVLKSGTGISPRDPVVINADGTTFYKTAFLEFYTRHYLESILEKKHKRYCRIVQIENSPTLGAAIAGLEF
ncbi:MAG: hexokinase [Candidatus Ornithospirochaeta sp.]|nr:hexokinase [Candidatus Ornithospirochaeta sp.]